MLPRLTALDATDGGLSYAVHLGQVCLGDAGSAYVQDLSLGEFAQSLLFATRLPVAPFSHHVGIVVGIGSGEQVGEFAARGHIARMTNPDVIGNGTIGINIDGAVDEPQSALPPNSAVTPLGIDVPLPQAAAGNSVSDGIEIDLLCERRAARGVFSGHRPFYTNTHLKETGYGR